MFAEEVADMAREIPDVQLAGFVENLDRSRCGPAALEGLPIYWIDDLGPLLESHVGVCALGTTRRRDYILDAERRGLAFTTLIHPTSRISPSARLGEGCIVNVQVAVAAHTEIGSHCILNRGALVGHHLRMGSFSTVGPGTRLGGASRYGQGVYIGIGATLVDYLEVGDHTVVGAGSVVTRSLPPRVKAYGVPARVVAEGIEGR